MNVGACRDRRPAAKRQRRLSRRGFFVAASGVASSLVAGISDRRVAAAPEPRAATGDYPHLDLHVHLDNSTIDQVLGLSRQCGVTFGIVEHAGTKENDYPVVLSNDAQLERYLDMLAGKPVYRGVQAEWIDWRDCFSLPVLSRLDYVLTDTMTFPGKDGRRVKLWAKDVEARVEMTDKQEFMERYVDWCVRIITEQPADILGNVSWLPAPLASAYDAFWTTARIRRFVAAAAEHQVALEISSSLRLPKLPFLKLARAAGVKFTFGSNGRFPHMGKLDYCVDMAAKLGLQQEDMFVPAADGRKAVQRRHAQG
jgi:hypothetical protein